MSVYSLYVINKSGGLIYSKDFLGSPMISINEKLRLASTFHSLHAIATQFAPTLGSEGIESVEASTFSLQCLKTPTGLKFFCIAKPGASGLTDFLNKVYVCYSDYLMKNPFYEPENPIRFSSFDDRIGTIARSY
ncbi:hypothetical protein WA158_003767 [Blastocystis sp. Blastoise]